MIRVLKKGSNTARVCTCDRCGTVMAYYESDILIKTQKMGFNMSVVPNYEFIRCPVCSNEVEVFEDDIGLNEYKEREKEHDRSTDTDSDKADAGNVDS